MAHETGMQIRGFQERDISGASIQKMTDACRQLRCPCTGSKKGFRSETAGTLFYEGKEPEAMMQACPHIMAPGSLPYTRQAGKDRDDSNRGKAGTGTMDEIDQYMRACRLCPRDCGADRLSGACGACGVPAEVYVARAALHAWEEPCISGNNGSGAVFFTGCGLKCVFCQNGAISGTAVPKRLAGTDVQKCRVAVPGKPVTVSRLAAVFLRLQNEQHANNINLVTAVQYIPQAAQALRIAKAQGLRIPVVYNSSGYEKAASLRLLEGLVDIWLPDFKYMDSELAAAYSHAPDYPDIAKRAIAEMVRQAGEPAFYEETRWGKDGEPMPAGSGARLMKRGVIVRHLLLPGHVKNAKAVVQYLHDTYGNSIYISMMNQYTPMRNTFEDSLLSRKVTKREYERLTDYAVWIGVENGFIQEGGTAEESFIPSWNGEGV